IPLHLRHYAMARANLTLSDKVPFIYARGAAQVADGFAMVRIARGLSEEAFLDTPVVTTVVNTNSPRQLDKPMTRGIIDFARAGQVTVLTPFCLAGAMAPITIAGALTLSHAEALAGIALAQIVRPGAPMVYGAFSSNVDMRSGAPAFGTPEHLKTNVGAGQLAARIGLPWRSGAGSASCAPDAQATYENMLALWGAIMGGSHLVYHAAGWIEGGLTCSFEKFVIDCEILQHIAEAFAPVPCTEAEIGLDAIAEVPPGGHFFSAGQTMARYASAFYRPFLSDLSNYGQWVEAGSRTATERANAIWKERVASVAPPAGIDEARIEELDAFIARRTEQGGARMED
ncbi:MAG: trimethylamine methyltransferase, partial [Alphaproteobacteria bacterium]